ncbi:MAG TPA: PaaI family thioesterase [Longimicrobiaceae bacterium]
MPSDDLVPRPHLQRLENLYHAAPITRWYGATIQIRPGEAEVRIPVRPEFFHAAGAVHGSVYFRALDDAAFFAVNSVVEEVLVLTVSFTTHFTRPVRDGELRARGWVVHQAGRLFVAESELRDGEGQLLAKASGTFTRSSIALDESLGYR